MCTTIPFNTAFIFICMIFEMSEQNLPTVWKCTVRFPAWTRVQALHFCSPQTFLASGRGGSSPRVKTPKREAKQSTPFAAGIKNETSCLLIPRFLLMVRCLIKQESYLNFVFCYSVALGLCTNSMSHENCNITGR